MSQDFDNDNKDAVVFASSLVDQVNRDDVRSMVQVQREMLSRYEKTNEMLINFNLLSASRFEASVKDFQTHTQLLGDMKQDLDSIFKRIRILKQRLSKAYPEAFAACSSVIMMEEEEEEESVDRPSSTTSGSSTGHKTSHQPPVQIKVDEYRASSADNIPASQKKSHLEAGKEHSSGHSSGDRHREKKSRDEKSGSSQRQSSSHRSHSGHKSSHSHSHSGSHSKPKTSH